MLLHADSLRDPCPPKHQQTEEETHERTRLVGLGSDPFCYVHYRIAASAGINRRFILKGLGVHKKGLDYQLVILMSFMGGIWVVL